MSIQIAKHMAIQCDSNTNNACETAGGCSCSLTHKI